MTAVGMSAPAPAALHRCVVVGAGAVGRMFADSLARSGCAVNLVDKERPAAIRGDLTDLGGRLVTELGRADLVLLAVSEGVAVPAVPGVAAAMRKGALLADTLSVKAQIVPAVQACAPGIQAVSLNPMFAPSLGMDGRPIAAVVVHDGPRVRELLALIGAWGGRVVPVTADQHDRLAAATQALTHAAVLGFGLALADLEVDVAELTAIASPPHATLLALLARIASGTPEVYWDVQAANPHARAARAALADGVRRLAELVARGDESQFTAMLAWLADRFGSTLDHHRSACARVFERG